MKKVYVLFGMLIFVALNAATLSVALDGSQAYSVIQDAIDEAISGDTILVYPGTYYENLLIEHKDITLASLELTTGDVGYKFTTILDGNQSGSVIQIASGVTNATVRGFTITNGTGKYFFALEESFGGGIFIGLLNSNNYIQIINCMIKKNVVNAYGGGIFSTIGNLYLSGVSIHNNQGLAGGGIFHQSSIALGYDLIFDPENRCSIYSNIGSRGGDIYLNYAFNYVEAVLDTFTVATPSSFYAAALVGSYGFPYPFCFDILNSVHEEVNADHYVAPWGDDDNDGLSPATPLKTFYEASYRIASDPLEPKTIHVANGYYSKSANDQILPVPTKSNCNIIGESKEGVIIDGEGKTLSFNIGPYDENINVANFTLQNASGVGIFCTDNINVHNIDLNVGSYNKPNVVSGISVSDSKNSSLSDCTISNFRSSNSMYGIYVNQFRGGDLRIKNVTISDMINHRLQTLKGVVFHSNVPSNIYIDGLKIHNLRNTYVDDFNSIMQIGPQNYTPGSTLRIEMKNSAFYDNYQSSGQTMGYIQSFGDTIFVSNCTFAGNEGGALAMNFAGNVVLENNVFWNPELTSELGVYYRIDPRLSPSEAIARMLLNNNCIRGGIGGIYSSNDLNEIVWQETNIDVDPLFAGGNRFPYALSPDSPLIDIGAPTPWEVGAVDAAGNERIWDGDGDGIAIIDIGAYEFKPVDQPFALTANLINNEVALSWQMLENESLFLNGYRIYRNDEAQGEVNDPSQWTFTDVLTANGIYEYYVVGLYSMVESPASNRVTVEITTISNEDEVQTPPVHKLSLSPNPFRDILVIRYHLEKHSDVELSIYNLRGQRIRRLQKESLPVGEQVLAWDGCDEYGRKMASGIYLMQLKVDGRRVSAEKFVKY